MNFSLRIHFIWDNYTIRVEWTERNLNSGDYTRKYWKEWVFRRVIFLRIKRDVTNILFLGKKKTKTKTLIYEIPNIGNGTIIPFTGWLPRHIFWKTERNHSKGVQYLRMIIFRYQGHHLLKRNIMSTVKPVTT